MEHALRILLADDETIVHQTIGDYLSECGHILDSAYDGDQALQTIETSDYDLALIDVRMPGIDGLSLLEKAQDIRPDMSIVIITGHGNMKTVTQALRLGAVDFLAKPIKLLELEAVLEKSLRFQELRRDRHRLRETIRGLQTSDERGRYFVGNSPETNLVRDQIRLAVDAQCDTILISGETGTGKEVAAREIHFEGDSDHSPFIAVSCPALPESLVESELFGHVKGAFTGATSDRAGYFEMADGGTLFLDEIADLSADAQAKMLRALETRTFRRVGGSKEISVNLRVVAATNTRL
ncbi:MAG: sigma-54 dependent transcriptional regulator, partial [bacterium]|nr:sigma-54 dependent transcriptional regulator [bacterium]